jgi:transposase
VLSPRPPSGGRCSTTEERAGFETVAARPPQPAEGGSRRTGLVPFNTPACPSLAPTGCVPVAWIEHVVTVRGTSYPRALTDDQWAWLQAVFNAPGKRAASTPMTVVDAMLYIAPTGCQGRYLPQSFGPWTRVWSQFRRWSRNGRWAQAPTVLHAAARRQDGREEGRMTRPRWSSSTPASHAEHPTAGSPFTTEAAPTAAPRAPSGSWLST